MKAKEKISLNSKIGKFYLAKKNGHSRWESMKIAGYAESGRQLEEQEGYKKIERYFKDELLDQITLKGLASELLKNINQDTDKGAKNNAIKMALDKIEPDKHLEDDDKSVLVVLKPIKAIEAEVDNPVDGEIIEEEDEDPEMIIK